MTNEERADAGQTGATGADDGAADLPRVLTRADLLRGSTDRSLRSQVRAGALERLHRDVYVQAGRHLRPEERYRLRVEAYVRQRREAGANPVLAGPAAAVVLGLPLGHRPPDVIHVTCAGSSGRALRGLARPVAPPQVGGVVERAGIRVVAARRTVLDVARLHSLIAGVVSADAALRSGECTAAELDAALGGMRGLRGVATARACAALATPLSESPGESWSAVVLHVAGLPEPIRQEVFSDDEGVIGRTDFWWPEHRVVGEFDGRVKYGRRNPSGRAPEEVLWAEKVREDRLRALGLTVVRWTADDLLRPALLTTRLRSALR